MFLMFSLPMVAEKKALAHKLAFFPHQKQGQWLLDSGSWAGVEVVSTGSSTLIFNCDSWSLPLEEAEGKLNWSGFQQMSC